MFLKHPSSNWLTVWINKNGSDEYLRLNSEDATSLLWWAFGFTKQSRLRADKFKLCIEEGRTTKASINVAREIGSKPKNTPNVR